MVRNKKYQLVLNELEENKKKLQSLRIERDNYFDIIQNHKRAIEEQDFLIKVQKEVEEAYKQKNKFEIELNNLKTSYNREKRQQEIERQNILDEIFQFTPERYKSYWWCGDETEEDFDNRLEELKDTIEYDKNNIKEELMVSNLDTYIFHPYWHLEDLINNLTTAQIKTIFKNLQKLIAWCMHFKCLSVEKKITANNYEKYEKQILDFQIKLEKMFSLMGIKIRTTQSELKKLYAISQYKKVQNEYRAERRRQAEILEEQKKIEAEELELEKKLMYAPIDSKEYKEYERKLENIQKISKFTRAGWLYVIHSNDSLPNVIKLGVTRRPDPMDRIRELSDASHSFEYVVYGFIWSEDVFKLETDIHKYFADRRVNQYNAHKENFFVTIDEVEEALHKLGYNNVHLNKQAYNKDYQASLEFFKNSNFNFDKFNLNCILEE